MTAEPPSPRVRLFPEIPGVAAGVASGPGGTARPGRTLRAWEPPAPPSEADRAREAAEARAVVQGTLDEAQATYRTDTGLVDTYFAEMANALRAGTESPPPLTPGATFVENLLSAWMPGAAAWARTGGNPYAAGQQGEARRPEGHEGQLSRLAQQAPGTEADLINRSFQSGAMFRDFADGRFGDGIVALVELRQARDGKLEGTALVRSSGNPLFDAHVMQTAPVALERLAPAPEHLVGAHPDGFRSLWSFEGRILFKTKKKPHELTLRDVAGAAAMLALNAVTQVRDQPERRKGQQPPGQEDEGRKRGVAPFTGSFDETSGEVGLVDLTQPRFHCRVKLLRVY